MDNSKYEAICRVIDAAKTHGDEDTDVYALEIIDILEGTSMRTLRVMLDVQVSPSTYIQWTGNSPDPAEPTWLDVRTLLADADPHVELVEVLGMNP